MSGRGFISIEDFIKCELCGKIAECRPYGPNNEEICFECMKKDEKVALKKASNYLFGEDN